MGRKVCEEIEEMLDDWDVNEVINVWEFLFDIQEELGFFYFDFLLYDDLVDMDSGIIQE